MREGENPELMNGLAGTKNVIMPIGSEGGIKK
jgi:hypothetical protein